VNEALTVAGPPRKRSRCLLPWLLLLAVVLALVAALWWGYTQRETVAHYAVSSLLDQQLGELLPEGEDPTRVAIRVAALMRAVKSGQLDADRLKGMGAMFREYYLDKKLSRDEFASLLAFAEAAVTR
jgi:hypothetical protein